MKLKVEHIMTALFVIAFVVLLLIMATIGKAI